MGQSFYWKAQVREMHNQSEEEYRKQMGQLLQGIKQKVREANGHTQDSDLSPLEQVTEQWLDLVSSFITPIGSGRSVLENGQLMELARQAMGSSDITEIFRQYGFADLNPDNHEDRGAKKPDDSTGQD